MHLRMLPHPASTPPLPTLCGGSGSRAIVMTAEHLQDMTPFGKTQISIGDVILSFDLEAKGFPSSPGRQWSPLWAVSMKIAGCQIDVRHFFETFYRQCFYFIIWVMYDNRPRLWEEKTKIQRGWLSALRSCRWHTAEGIWSPWQSDPRVLVPRDAVMLPWGNGAKRVVLGLAGSENMVKQESPLKNSPWVMLPMTFPDH